MGGPGSTRWDGRRVKTLVEDTPRLSISDYLSGLKGKSLAEVAVQDGNGEESHQRTFQIVRLPLSKGGYGLRIVCDCGRRCRFIYFVDNRLCCQQCGRLLHRSTRTRDWAFEKLFKELCRENNIVGLSFSTFIKQFRRR